MSPARIRLPRSKVSSVATRAKFRTGETTRSISSIAFGFGEHLCLGASLARLEARVMFEELFARWPRFALAGEPTPLASILMNGLERMPVVLEP